MEDFPIVSVNQDLDKSIEQMYGLIRAVEDSKQWQNVEITLKQMMHLLHVFSFYVTRVHLGKCWQENKKEKEVLLDQQNIASMFKNLYKRYLNIDILSFYQKETDAKDKNTANKEIEKLAKDRNEWKYFAWGSDSATGDNGSASNSSTSDGTDGSDANANERAAWEVSSTASGILSAS